MANLESRLKKVKNGTAKWTDEDTSLSARLRRSAEKAGITEEKLREDAETKASAKRSEKIAADKKKNPKKDPLVEALTAVSNFASGANDKFLGGGLEEVIGLGNWVGSGFNGEEADKKTAKVLKEKFGQKDDGTNVLSTGRGTKARQAGEVAGTVQKGITDVASLVVPGAAAEKAIRGTRAISKLAGAGKKGRVGAEVVGSVGGGLAATGVGAVTDPRQAVEDTEQFGKDAALSVGIDAALGVGGGVLSSIGRGARETKKALEAAENAKRGTEEVDEFINRAPESRMLGSGEDTARTRLQEIQDLKRAQNEGTADATSFQDRLPGMDELGTPAVRTQTPELRQRATQLEDEVATVDEEIANIARQKDEVVLDDIKFNTARRDLEMAHDKALEEIANMPGPSRPGALDSRAIMATNLEKKFEADMTELVNRYESRDELAKTFDDALEEASARRFEVEAQGTRELEEISAREAQVQAERQEAVRNMSADDWRKLNQEEEELTRQVTELESVRNLSASDVTGPDTDDLLDPQKSPENFNEDGTLNTEKVKTEFKARQKETAYVNHEKSFKETATSDPTAPVTADDRANVLTEQITDLEIAGKNLAHRTMGLWAPFELPAQVLRKIGLEDTAKRLDKQILFFKRANHDDIKTIDGARKGVRDKEEDLFDAVTDPQKYSSLSVQGKKAVDEWRKYAEKAADELGLPPQARMQDYIHHAFLKDGREGVAKLTAANETIARLEDLVANGGRTGRSLGSTKAALTKAKRARDALLDTNSLDLARMRKDTGKINPNFLKKRQGADGYSKDFWNMWEVYSQQKNRKVHIEPISTELSELADKGVATGDPLKGWLQGYSEQLRGIQSGIDKAFGETVVSGMKRGRTAMSLAKLGFSANSVINSTSQFINLAPVLGAKSAAQGSAQALALVGRLGKNKLTRQETEMFDKMARDGLFEGSSQLIPEEALKRYGHNFQKAAFSGIMGADRFMRMSAYLGAKTTAKGKELARKADDFAAKNGEDVPNPFQDELDAYAIMMSNKVNQNFDQVVSPTFFRSQVARSLGSMVTFVPGQIVRGVDVAGGGARGAVRLATGKTISQKTYQEDIDKIAKVLYLAGGIALANETIGRVTGSEDSMPNIFNRDTWNTPALQLIAGNENSEGILDLLATDKDGEGDQMERAISFFTETLPGYTVPGWSQGKRWYDGKMTNIKGYSERKDGGARFFTEENDPVSALQREVFGQYSTPNGREYIKSGFNNYSADQTSKIMEAASPAQKAMYQDFYKADNNFTETVRKDFKIKGGRTGLSKEITKLIKDGDENKARRYAEEWNAIVDLAYEEPKAKYNGMIPEDLLEEVEKMKIPTTEDAFQRRYKQ